MSKFDEIDQNLAINFFKVFKRHHTRGLLFFRKKLRKKESLNFSWHIRDRPLLFCEIRKILQKILQNLQDICNLRRKCCILCKISQILQKILQKKHCKISSKYCKNLAQFCNFRN